MKILFKLEEAKEQKFIPLKVIYDNDLYDKNEFIEYELEDINETPDLYYDSEKKIIREFVEDDYIRLGVFDQFGMSTFINGEKIDYPKSCELMKFDFKKKKYVFDKKYAESKIKDFFYYILKEKKMNTIYSITKEIEPNIFIFDTYIFYFYHVFNNYDYNATMHVFSDRNFSINNNFFKNYFKRFENELETNKYVFSNESELKKVCNKIKNIFTVEEDIKSNIQF